MEFTIKASYDASPQFHLAATYESDSRWTLDKKITVYEGNGVNSELYKVMLGDKNPNSEQPTRRDSPTDALHIPWTASFSGSRNWSMGNRDGSRTKPTLRCNDQNGTQGRIWDDAGSEDSYSFEADVTDQTKSGHLTTRFINAPDYEIPTDANKDNTYNVRIVGSHRIHKLGTPERTFGCETSAIDFTVTVKDVGPPAPLQELTLTQDPTDNAKFNIAWDSSNLNEFLEDGKRVDFPHTEFNVSSISFAHSPSGLTFPDSKTESPITITPGSGNEINGVVGTPGTTYTITASLINSEINSESPPTTVSKSITLTRPASPPEKPTVTTTGPTSLSVAWETPETHGSTITGYAIRLKPDESETWTTWNEAITGTTETVTTLQPDTTYSVQVRTNSSNGESEWSESASATTDSFTDEVAHLFPKGVATKLQFNTAIAGDPDGSGGTYTFTFAHPDQNEKLTPADPLLNITGPDTEHDFSITAVADTTPDQFRDLYGSESNSVTLAGTLTATNTIKMSTDLTFNLTLTYDDSPQFGTPATYQSQNRWVVTDTYETYESSTALPSISVPWVALTSGNREWQAGTPTTPTFKCTDQTGETLATWPADGEKDSSLFTVTSDATAQSGTVTVAFLTQPDYENPTDDEGSTTVDEQNPGDNIYQLRVTASNNLQDLGCNGSALDVTIKVKNVGPPDSPTISSAAFDAIDSTMINITWTESTTYTENGQSIVFPNEDFHVSKYQYRYRWGPAQPWSEVQETTSTSAKLTGLDKTGYIFQVNAVNSEGESGWTETTIGELENQPPTVSSPSPSEVSYMFPFGKPGTLNYNSPAGADDDGDDLTYHFKVTLDEIVPAVDGFLMFTPDGDNFTMKASKTVTPQEWIDTHAADNIKATVMPATIYANDGEDDSAPGEFNISLYYDPSAFFTDPAVHQTDNRYAISEPFTTYEGPAAGANIEIPWSSAVAGARNWAAGNPTTAAICREGSDNRNLDWPAAGNEDSSKLSVPGTTSGKSGKLTPSFTTAPDFESPNDTGGDKTYEVRLHNKHNLHNPSSDFPSCSGSAVDFKITIKDVGTPSLVTPTGQFATDDTTKVNLKWDAPTGFMEENETFVTFPHKAFAPSSYDYRYRNTPTDPWTEVNGITITSAPITGLTASTLQVQVRATNSEGTSPWPKESVTIVKLTQASISAVNPSINEGEDAEFLVTLDLISNLTVNLRYDWSGSHGYANTGTVTFTDSKSETLSIPTTTIGDSGSLTVTIASSTGYTIGNSNQASVNIGRKYTPPATPAAPSLTALSSTSIQASWTRPSSQSSITGYTIRYSVANENDWTEQTATITNATINGLKSGTSYDVAVKARNADGTSEFSATATTTTDTIIATITSDQSSVIEGNAASFTVALNENATVTINLTYAWTGGHGSTAGSTVSFSSSDSETISIPTSTSGNNGSLEVTIIKRNAYIVGSPNSATANIYIQNLPPTRPAPPGLTPLSTTSIRASWQAPSSLLPIDQYTLRYRENGTQQWTEQNVNRTTYDMSSLTVNTEYDVQIQAHSASGASEWSQTSTASTRDLTITITADQASVTEGETAYFTLTLSTQASVQVNVQYTWEGDFGSTGAQQVQILNTSTYEMSVQTRTSTTPASGSITASLIPSNAYRITGPIANVNINKIQIPEPTTPVTPTPITPTPITPTPVTPTPETPTPVTPTPVTPTPVTPTPVTPTPVTPTPVTPTPITPTPITPTPITPTPVTPTPITPTPVTPTPVTPTPVTPTPVTPTPVTPTPVTPTPVTPTPVTPTPVTPTPITPTPVTPTPITPTPEPTDDSAGETPEPTDPPKTTTEPTAAPPTAAPPTAAPPTAAPPTAAPPTAAPPTSEPTQGPGTTNTPKEANPEVVAKDPTKASPTPTTTPIPQPTPTYRPEPTIRPTVVITSIIDDPTPVPQAMTTTTAVSVPPTPSKSQHELNPRSEKQSGHILLTPTRWFPEQIQNLIPATRNAIKAITVLPRERATLVAVLAVVMVVAGGIFVYLIRRRSSMHDQQDGLEHPEIR